MPPNGLNVFSRHSQQQAIHISKQTAINSLVSFVVAREVLHEICLLLMQASKHIIQATLLTLTLKASVKFRVHCSCAHPLAVCPSVTSYSFISFGPWKSRQTWDNPWYQWSPHFAVASCRTLHWWCCILLSKPLKAPALFCAVEVTIISTRMHGVWHAAGKKATLKHMIAVH